MEVDRTASTRNRTTPLLHPLLERPRYNLLFPVLLCKVGIEEETGTSGEKEAKSDGKGLKVRMGFEWEREEIHKETR